MLPNWEFCLTDNRADPAGALSLAEMTPYFVKTWSKFSHLLDSYYTSNAFFMLTEPLIYLSS
jgi:hypothetical protein